MHLSPYSMDILQIPVNYTELDLVYQLRAKWSNEL